MKIIFRDTNQPRAYADSIGSMLVELEPDENKEEVIKQLTENNSYWYTNIFDKELSEYLHNGKLITGRLLLFTAKDGYTG